MMLKLRLAFIRLTQGSAQRRFSLENQRAACFKTGFLFLLPWLAGWAAHAGPEFDQGPALNLTEENDFVHGTDRWYTQGAKIAYLQADNQTPPWTETLFDHVPALGFSIGAERIGYELGQSMFTPANTHASELLPNDRPYAGWLYTGLILQRRGAGVGGFPTLENYQLELGIIGPDSVAGRVQTWYHHHAPAGWKNQLPDEPGFALKYGRAWLISLPSSEERYLDVIPEGGLSAGDVDTSFRAGAALRLGWNLPEDFGVQPIDSLLTTEGGWSSARGGRRWGFYIFSGVEGRAVLYNAFLDGDAFRDSPHVDKEPFVGEWRSGLVLVLNRVELAYTHIFRTREFEKQPAGEVYGSFCVRVLF
jgi:lipid A 3-O-deacylase